MKILFSMRTAAGFAVVFFFSSCPVPENNVTQAPVNGIEIFKNQETEPLDPRSAFEIPEGKAAILSARLLPDGVAGGIHWQSSRRGIVELSSFTGPEITITGQNGGKALISLLARNRLNEVYAQAECTVIVIPFSFFKWNFAEDGWLDVGAHENVFIGKIRDTIVRSGENPVLRDDAHGGLVLEGPGAIIIGSGMTTATSSAFSNDPVYDQNGEFDFFGGPAYEYLEGQGNLKKTPWPLWNNRVKISVDYEMIGGSAPLRIQVNNNTLQRDAASAIDNWLVAELGPASPPSGTLSGIFRGNGTAQFDPLFDFAKKAAINGSDDEGKLKMVLSHSFVSLALPDGKVLIRGIRIESAD
ncbi:MAG: hypothetical protein LBB72_03045 [Spirochaetaceae bacterium]|nr:hypothetical protein [Spirochaetaceae bacterium]